MQLSAKLLLSWRTPSINSDPHYIINHNKKVDRSSLNSLNQMFSISHQGQIQNEVLWSFSSNYWLLHSSFYTNGMIELGIPYFLSVSTQLGVIFHEILVNGCTFKNIILIFKIFYSIKTWKPVMHLCSYAEPCRFSADTSPCRCPCSWRWKRDNSWESRESTSGTARNTWHMPLLRRHEYTCHFGIFLNTSKYLTSHIII